MKHDELSKAFPPQLTDAVVKEQLPALQRSLASHLSDVAAEAALAAASPDRRAVLRSVSCHPAASWLTAKPTCPTLVLGNPAFRAAVRRRLHVPCLPTAGPCSDCVCGQKAAEIGPDHALNCPNVWGLTVSRHDELAKAVRDALSRAGATTSLEPHLSAFAGNPAARAAAQRYRKEGEEARGDVLCTLGGEQMIIDVSVTNPLSASYVGAAAERAGAAAQKRDETKTAAYAAREDSGYKFIPFSVETHGRLGLPAMALLGQLGSAASEASLGAFSKTQFVNGVLQQLSAVLNKYNSRMEASVAGFVLRHPGREWRRPCAATSREIGQGL